MDDGTAFATPRIVVGRARVFYIGPGLRLQPHRNAAATIAFGLESPFELERLEPTPQPQAQYSVALIPPGTLHHLHAHGPMGFLYLDGLSDDLAVATQRLTNGEVTDVTALATDRPRAVLDAIADALGLQDPERGPDPLEATIRAVDERPQDFGRMRDAAEHAGLSESRFRHVFRQRVGMPFRRYRLWRRMAVVAKRIDAGDTLTAAALEAGFASSAHFSEAFRQMFGLSPSALLSAGAVFEFEDQKSAPPVSLQRDLP